MSRFVNAVLLAAAMLANVVGTSHAAIIISEVDPASSGNSSVAADWFELTNTGASGVNITGWKVDDNSNLFGSSLALLGITSIQPGQSVIFAESTNLAATQALFVNAWFGGITPAGFLMGSYSGSGIGFGTGGDAVNIFNAAGVLQANISFGAASTGFTFDNAAGLTGPVSQFSAVGVNGAFAGSSDGRVGSPGIVPIPAAAWLLGSAFGVLGVIRRRRAG